MSKLARPATRHWLDTGPAAMAWHAGKAQQHVHACMHGWMWCAPAVEGLIGQRCQDGCVDGGQAGSGRVEDPVGQAKLDQGIFFLCVTAIIYPDQDPLAAQWPSGSDTEGWNCTYCIHKHACCTHVSHARPASTTPMQVLQPRRSVLQVLRAHSRVEAGVERLEQVAAVRQRRGL